MSAEMLKAWMSMSYCLRRNTNELVSCVVQNHADAAVAVIESGKFDELVLTDLEC